MKRAVYETIISEDKAYSNMLSKWIKHVLDCKKDASIELGKIYKELTGEHKINDFKLVLRSKVGFVLVSEKEDVAYLYFLNSVLYYGPEKEEYPIDDKSLWPWTAVNGVLPQLSKDIWQCLIRLSAPKDRMAVSLCNKMLYKLVHEELFWEKERAILYSYYIIARPFLDKNPTWKFFAKLMLWYKRRSRSNPCNNSMDDLLLFNLQLPFGDNVSVPVTWKVKRDKFKSIHLLVNERPIWWQKQPRYQKVEVYFRGLEIWRDKYHIRNLFMPVVTAILNGSVNFKILSPFVDVEQFQDLFRK